MSDEWYFRTVRLIRWLGTVNVILWALNRSIKP